MGVLTLTMHGSVEAMLRYRLDTALRIFLNCHAELAEAQYLLEQAWSVFAIDDVGECGSASASSA